MVAAPVHGLRVAGFAAEREAWQTVGERVDPQDLGRQQRQAQPDDRLGLLHAAAVVAVRVAVPDDEVLQGEMVDLVVVFGLDPVGFGLAVLAEQEQRGRVAAWVENSRLSRMNGSGS
jgi:hypothetical protein